MNVVTFAPHFEKMRNFMLDVDKYLEPLNYVAQSVANSSTYPFHNIYKKDENHVIEIALAGFTKDEIEVELEPNILTIQSTKYKGKTPTVDMKFNGISNRNFRRVFYLADMMRVISCKMENGMLTITIKKEVPEENKPTKITVE